MNGMFNNNFLIGMLMARELPRQEQFLTGLVSGRLPVDEPIAPLLLKPIIDKRAAAESAQQNAESTATALQQPLEVELPPAVSTATLRVPGVAGVTFSRISGSAGTAVDTTTGVVTLPQSTDPGEVTIAVAQDGVVRNVTILRGSRSSRPGTGQPSGATLIAADVAREVVAQLRSQIEAISSPPSLEQFTARLADALVVRLRPHLPVPSTPGASTGGSAAGGGNPVGGESTGGGPVADGGVVAGAGAPSVESHAAEGQGSPQKVTAAKRG